MFSKSNLILLIIFSGITFSNTKDSILQLIDKEDQFERKAELYIDLSFEHLFSSPDSSLYYAKKADSIAIETDDNYQEGRAKFMQAKAWFEKKNFDSIYFNLDKAKDIFENDEKFELDLADVYVYFSEMKYLQSNFEEAVQFVKKALPIFKNSKDTLGYANCFTLLGKNYDSMSQYLEAVKYYEEALKIVTLQNDSVSIAKLKTNIAVVLHYDEKYERALKYLEEAENLFKVIDVNGEIINVYANFAINYQGLEDYKTAEKYLLLTDSLAKAFNDINTLATNLNNLGINYKKLKKYKKAIETYNRSLEIFQNYQYKRGIATNYTNLGRVYYQWGLDNNESKKIAKSIDFYKKAELIFIEIQDKNYLSEVYKYLSDSYYQINDFRKAYDYKDKYHKVKDSLFNIEKSKEIESLIAVRENLEKEKKLTIANQKNEAQKKENKIITNSAILIISLVGLFLLIIYLRFRKEKVLSRELENKNKYIEEANEELEIQQKQLEKNHYELVHKNEEILASIRYAQTIQDAMLPWDSELKKYLKNYFLIFKPKDIVSGDFYWFKALEDGYLLAVADCTGHGVPGSMISMMGSSILDEAVLSQGLKDTGEILTYLNSKMIESLNKQVSENASRDGMDICLVRVKSPSAFGSSLKGVQSENMQDDSEDKELSSLKRHRAISDLKVQFSGAKRPLFIIQNDELQTIKGDRNSIAGERHLDEEFQFSTNDIKLESNSQIYLTSDGFVDQIGSNGKKFGTKRLKQIISQNKPLNDINSELNNDFNNHIGSEEQRDDVTILGVEL